MKLNSVYSSKQARFEGKTPLVPFVDFLQLESTASRHEESRPAIESPEPARPTQKKERKEPDVHAKRDERTEHETENEDGENETLATSPENETESPNASRDEEGVSKTAEAAKAKDGKPAPESEPQIFALPGVKPEIPAVTQNAIAVPQTAEVAKPAFPTGPVVLAEEGIEPAASVTAAPSKAAGPAAGPQATSAVLLPQGLTVVSELPAVDARLAAGKETLATKDNTSSPTKAAGPLVFNGEGKDGLVTSQAGTGQPLPGGAKPFSQMPAPSAPPVLPNAGMDIGIPTLTANLTPAPTGEAPSGGLAPLNASDVAATRTAGLTMPMHGRTPAAAPPLIDQVAVHMKQAAADGLDHIRIQLKPSSLGHIDVKMEIAKDGKVMAVISIERPETFDLLQRDARALERALLGSGLQTDSNSLNFQLRGQENGQTTEHSPTGNAPTDNSEGLSEEAEVAPLMDYDTWIVGDGIVDIRV
ncbi:MAG: flagellar hook-length control protein FliK [Alphaproteobacteria bacterium]|nr:flagellar hook-length control protein FliK [Alphaproteobacteria bacterium]